ncbi:hypothetical protein K493DRAFT_410377 [Basidiobolus meristosporus CBS 931.73]|uniref:C3H1-type domain-containing protein n=1 Tax=Basidiobolus meristosporus CBS 931.73 TaxID=1314790 RepID=A0A1Y1XUW9_9FUNG|nr:hypothetical protein K493DRAFT_410377 [Basidiobolus meristosporus CBS 931.73]|eukprot:ORX89540.1 hypothetical protein K493DRAFT_410377 [Basidiobolus meristosporus CBS 931.73]
MLFDDTELAKLRDQLIAELEPICDADPPVLADYVIALLQHDKPESELKAFCLEQLGDFLADETEGFVNKLFDSFKTGQPSNSEEFTNQESATQPPNEESEGSDDDGDRNFKRTRREDSAEENEHKRVKSELENQDSSNHARNRGGYPEDSRSKVGKSAGDYPHDRTSTLPPQNSHNFNSSRDNYNEWNSGRRGGRGGRGGFGDQRPRRQRCRDYDEKGYCMRGDLCPYDHGVDRIVVDDPVMKRGPFDMPRPPINGPPLGGPVNMMGSNTNRPPYFMGGKRNQQRPEFNGPRGMPGGPEAYDPERADFNGPNSRVPMGDGPDNRAGDIPMMDNPWPNNRGRGRGRGGRGRGMGNRYGANPNPHTKTSLVVENIPHEFCTIDKVNDFFKKFGVVTNINLDFHGHKAVVQFSSNSEAYKAYNSPEPIFDNRFVKVYWHKNDGDDISSAPAEPAPSNKWTAPSVQTEPISSPNTPEQTKMAEKAKKHQEHLKMMLEIQKQKEQLVQKQIEQQKLLMEQLSKGKNISPEARREILNRLNQISESIKEALQSAAKDPLLKKHIAPPKNVMAEKEKERLDRELDSLSQLNESEDNSDKSAALRAKVESLKAEAASLGVEIPSSRGGRGGFRGRIAHGGWPRRSLKLDNRSKILIKNVPSLSTEELKGALESYGEVEFANLNAESQTAVVQFKTRAGAEQALKSAKTGPLADVELSWDYDTKPAPSQVKPAKQPQPLEEGVNTGNLQDPYEEEDEEDVERSWKR